MATALDAPESMLDAHERRFVTTIREHGWHDTSVAGDNAGPGFCYTTGFSVTLGFPEVIVFALRPEIAHDVLWDLYRDVEAGKPPAIDTPARLFSNSDGILRPVLRRHYPNYLGWSRWFYGNDDFRCLQLFVPNRDGVFPWQPEAHPDFRATQPNLCVDDA